MKQLMRGMIGEHFSLLEKRLNTLPLTTVYNYTELATGCQYGRFSALPLLLRQFPRSPAPSKKLQEWCWKISGMKPIPYKTAVFLLTRKADRRENRRLVSEDLLSNEKGLLHIRCEITLGNIDLAYG